MPDWRKTTVLNAYVLEGLGVVVEEIPGQWYAHLLPFGRGVRGPFDSAHTAKQFIERHMADEREENR